MLFKFKNENEIRIYRLQTKEKYGFERERCNKFFYTKTYAKELLKEELLEVRGLKQLFIDF